MEKKGTQTNANDKYRNSRPSPKKGSRAPPQFFLFFYFLSAWIEGEGGVWALEMPGANDLPHEAMNVGIRQVDNKMILKFEERSRYVIVSELPLFTK